ncbi:hypothetical protein [uncultured virus]|uniref:Uncharacterized protein n=1 Tax=uncultured virus TaxID=340016 RepID=A0A218ML02_9VIRU|nr:hypothetical protein [uncultured virus]
MKILLSPAWDHNFLLGPARWTSGTPYGHADQGGQDNYHPRPVYGISETGDPWWPDESNINDPAGRFCWDADERIISNSAFRLGGRVGNQFQPGFEATETKNRFRGTGTPMTAFDADDVTYINKISKEQQDTNVDAFEVKRSLPSHYQDYVHDAILQNSDPSDPTSALHKIYPNKPGTTPLGSVGGYGVYQSGTRCDSAKQRSI